MLRETLVRCQRLPLVLRVRRCKTAPGGLRKARNFAVEPWELTLHAEYAPTVSAC